MMTKQSAPEARTFFVDARFQRMARRPGGVPRSQAIRSAELEIEKLKPDFADWLGLKLAETATAVRQIEDNSGDVSRLDAAYRSCAELRDVGTTMGFELISVISNNLCEVLDAIKTGAAYHRETIECHLDALLLTSKAPYCNLRPEQLPEMTAGLRRAIERTSLAPPESANSNLTGSVAIAG
ncbi:MAG: hypothetical protein WB444_15820 [Gallionella sp.]